PAATSALSAGTAKSGVPMKARRRRAIIVPAKTRWGPLATTAPATSRGSAETPRWGSERVLAIALEDAGALRLQELAQDHVALERGDVVDEQDAVEMVHFVLDASGQQAVRRELAHLI